MRELDSKGERPSESPVILTVSGFREAPLELKESLVFLDCTDRVRMAMSPRANAATLSRSCSGRAPDSSCAQLIPASVHIRERGRLERNALELCGCIRLCAADGGADHRLQGLDKGLWRGVGERHLRGLYNGPASSSIGHHQFREEASTRSAR